MSNVSWIEEMQTENKKAIRAELNAWVRSYCWARSLPHRDVWNKLYGLFERTTGERLPEKDRMDWLEANELLGKLRQMTRLMR